MQITDNQKIGVMLCALGVLFLALGVMMFLDTNLMTIGNVLFLAGLGVIMGVQQTYGFFATRWRKVGARGPLCFFGGIALVLFKWPMLGMILEAFGFLNLFGNFFPLVIASMRQMPLFSTMLNLPVISTLADKLAGSNRAAQWA